MSRALKLHNAQYHYHPSKHMCNQCNNDYGSKADLEQHKQHFASSIRKRLSDSKRQYIRSISLVPLCTYQSLPSVTDDHDMDYHEKLRMVERSTKIYYESENIAGQDGSESTQS